jgi:hypothetical protein
MKRQPPDFQVRKREIDLDSFSDGQVRSKIWLCEKLEPILNAELLEPARIWVFGGWYGIFSFLLLARARVAVREIHSFDLEEEATDMAWELNRAWWVGHEGFSASRADVNELGPSFYLGDRSPDLVVNTSCEHFSSDRWFESIPPGTLVALQATDMPHPDHLNGVSSVSDLKARFQRLREVKFSGELRFEYKDWSFTRYMLIGRV